MSSFLCMRFMCDVHTYQGNINVARLYGFKIHPLAYQIQQQAAANFKAPLRSLSYNNGKR